MENKYFIVSNDRQLGPYDIEELKEMKIEASMLVWKEGFVDWVTADSVDELKSIFQHVPPPIPKKIANEVIIKTEEPIQFEDNFKKQNLVEKKNKIEITKNKSANEIKTILKLLKYGVLSGLVVFLIVFIVFGGFQHLYYDYLNADKNTDYYNYCVPVTVKEWQQYDFDVNREKLNYAWEQSLQWGSGILCLIFPGLYLLNLLKRTFLNSKLWIEKHATK